jgi:uncharacterized protein (DUF1800 family)
MQQATPQTTASEATAEAETTNPEPSSSDFSPAYLSLLGSALLAACSGGGDGTGGSSATGVQSDSASAQAANGTVTANMQDSVAGYKPAGASANGSTYSAAGFNNFPVAYSPNDAARFLLQSQFNATDAEIAAVSSGTFASYLQQQFAKPIGQTGWDWLEARGYGVSDKNSYFFSAYPADGMIWNQLFTSQDAMRKRMALALSEFFVSSLQSAEFTWRSHAYAQYWDTLAANAFGNYRQLLEAITLNPAMGYFLNTKGNLKENVATGRLPDANYGREVMQLVTIGLYQLNLDGTEKLDANGKKIETYTQSDVSNLARVFTGYDFDNTGIKGTVPVYNSDGTLATYKVDERDSVRRPMKLNAANHSTLAATFLGAPTIAAGVAGDVALQTALNTLFNHANVGPFFGKQMIQRLVTSNPSPAYVARVAAAFNNNGAGVRGDLKAVWTAIFLDDEARRTYTVSTTAAPANTSTIQNAEGRLNRDISDKSFGKLREPMLRFVQWGRTFGLGPVTPPVTTPPTHTYDYWKIPDTSSVADALAQSPLRSPSVFNYFRPGFVPPSTALAATNTPAPEFQIVNETTVGGYLNYMQDVIRSGLRSYIDPSVPEASYPANNGYKLHTAATYAQELALVGNPTALVKRLNLLMCAGQISSANETLMITALTTMPVNSTVAATLLSQQMDRVCAAVLMVMANSEYLIQK